MKPLKLFILFIYSLITIHCKFCIAKFAGGEGRIRTSEGFAGRFTVCSLWPLGNLSLEPPKGIEPPTR